MNKKQKAFEDFKKNMISEAEKRGTKIVINKKTKQLA